MNKKGFVLIETLVVTIFTLFTFTILYNSAVPLLGKYQELSYYDDLDTTYDLYHVSKLIKNDLNYDTIKNSHYKVISCNSLNDQNSCNNLFSVLNISSGDEVIFLNTSYISELENDNNISDDIKNYLKYHELKGNNLLLQNDGYVSYLPLMSSSEKIKNSIEKSTCSPSITDTDGTIYLSGTNACVNFNYVWYSGKLWRITSINPDGTMKMITEDAITTINWGSKATVSSSDLTSAYGTSWMREWLNQEFLPTLYNYENIIVEDAGWYSITDSSSTPTKPTGDYTLNDPVGLLNAYEYYMSYQNTVYGASYLNIGYSWWLITPKNSSSVRYINDYGYLTATINPSATSAGIRPSINLKSTIQLVGGAGTVTDPYRIKGDQEEVEVNVTLLNTRQSGEYVKLSSDETTPTFRIVGTELVGENLTTKMVLNDYVKDTNDVDGDSNTTEVLTKYFSSSDSYELWTEVDKTDPTYWRGYLNNTWIKEIDNTYNETNGTSSILEKGIYYLGYHTTGSYKTSVCSSVSSDVSAKKCIENGTVVTNTSSDDYVGLQRVGEMFASRFGRGISLSSEMWLITPYNSSDAEVRFIRSDGLLSGANSSNYSYRVRPTINLKSTIIIKSGSGTQEDPFIVGI